MPRFYLHLHTEAEFPDEEGQELSDLAAAREEAVTGARSLIAEGAKDGLINLNDRIEIIEEGRQERHIIRFRDVVEIIG